MEATTPIIKKTKGIKDFLNCAFMFLFLTVKLKEVCVTQNDTPKMVKCPPILISCHFFLRNMSTKTSLKKLRLHQKGFEWTDDGGLIRNN